MGIVGNEDPCFPGSPDICFRNRKTNTCLLIDISCPADGNIARKQAEKLTIYSDLQVEVTHIWQCWTLVPVVFGSIKHSACRYCAVAEHYSRSSQPEALTTNSASWIQSDPT